jgi:hypothetical protein
VLTVHHIDGDETNLMSWDLVALCLTCHDWAGREVTLDQVGDVEQLSLAPADPPAWLVARRRDRERFPRARPVQHRQRAGTRADEALRATERPGVDAGRSGSRPTPAPFALGPAVGLCACSCGQPIPASEPGQRRYVDRAHQQRAYRERRETQTSLLTLLRNDG